MADKNLLRLGEIYGDMLSQVTTVAEKTLSKKEQKMGKKPGKGPKELNDKTAGHLGNDDTSGPANADGYQPPVIDQKNQEEDEETVEKIVQATLNNFMTKKSIFDKLFESVINEDDAELSELGIDTGAEGEGEGDDLGAEGEGEDTVTLTLDRATAEKLHDMLMDVLGGNEAEAESDLGAEGDEHGEMEFGGEEDEEAPKSAVSHFTGKNNKVGNADVQAGKGHEGDGTYTDTIEGGKDHNVKPAVSKLTGKSNKVDASKIKPGKSAFSH